MLSLAAILFCFTTLRYGEATLFNTHFSFFTLHLLFCWLKAGRIVCNVILQYQVFNVVVISFFAPTKTAVI